MTFHSVLRKDSLCFCRSQSSLTLSCPPQYDITYCSLVCMTVTLPPFWISHGPLRFSETFLKHAPPHEQVVLFRLNGAILQDGLLREFSETDSGETFVWTHLHDGQASVPLMSFVISVTVRVLL